MFFVLLWLIIAVIGYSSYHIEARLLPFPRRLLSKSLSNDINTQRINSIINTTHTVLINATVTPHSVATEVKETFISWSNPISQISRQIRIVYDALPVIMKLTLLTVYLGATIYHSISHLQLGVEHMHELFSRNAAQCLAAFTMLFIMLQTISSGWRGFSALNEILYGAIIGYPFVIGVELLFDSCIQKSLSLLHHFQLHSKDPTIDLLFRTVHENRNSITNDELPSYPLLILYNVLTKLIVFPFMEQLSMLLVRQPFSVNGSACPSNMDILSQFGSAIAFVMGIKYVDICRRIIQTNHEIPDSYSWSHMLCRVFHPALEISSMLTLLNLYYHLSRKRPMNSIVSGLYSCWSVMVSILPSMLYQAFLSLGGMNPLVVISYHHPWEQLQLHIFNLNRNSDIREVVTSAATTIAWVLYHSYYIIKIKSSYQLLRQQKASNSQW